MFQELLKLESESFSSESPHSEESIKNSKIGLNTNKSDMTCNSEIEIFSSSETQPNKMLNKKRRKNNSGKKAFSCKMCKKSYFSYSALYLHKRNKHNIIPYCKNKELFSSIQNNSRKSKYKDFSKLLSLVIQKYENCLHDLFMNNLSVLFKENFNVNNFEGNKILKTIQTKGIKTFQILQNKKVKICIDDVLIIYLLNFSKLQQEETFTETVIKFVILLREYLNLVGWDYIQKFSDFGVNMDFNKKGSFTLHNGCHEIPDLINDFLSVFLWLDEKCFNLEMSKIIYLTENFCNFLFVNELTNFKLYENYI